MMRCLSRWICTTRSISGRVVNEFRHNLVTDDWVVFSSARRGRPRQVQPVSDRCNLTSLPSHDATCPFCLGNEHETPEATLTMNYPGTDKWRLRVVPNKFPALETKGELEKRGLGVFDRMNGVGTHEVIVDIPDHMRYSQQVSCAHFQSLHRKYPCREHQA